MWAEDKANPCEHDRAADPRPLDPAGDRAVAEKERSQHRRVLVHLILQISQRTLTGCGKSPDFEKNDHETGSIPKLGSH
jgi:hypothetical protein